MYLCFKILTLLCILAYSRSKYTGHYYFIRSTTTTVVEVNLAFRSCLNRFQFKILSTVTTVVRFLSIYITCSQLYIHIIYSNIIYLTMTTYALLQKVNDNRIQVASDLLYIIRGGSPSYPIALFTCAIPLYTRRTTRYCMI